MKHSLPAVRRDQFRADGPAQYRTERETAEHHCDERGAAPAWRIFGGDGDDARDRAAEAETGEETERHQLPHRLCPHRPKREHGKQNDRDEEYGAAAVAIAERTEQNRTDQPAEQPDPEHRAELRLRHVPGVSNHRRDKCDRLGVEAVHHCDREAERDDDEAVEPQFIPLDHAPRPGLWPSPILPDFMNVRAARCGSL